MSEWTKSAQPVLQAGAAGAFDALAAQGPCVLKVGSQYTMWYDARPPGQPRSIPSVGLATCSDGRTWAKHPGSPVIMPEARWAWVLPLPPAPGTAPPCGPPYPLEPPGVGPSSARKHKVKRS